MPSQPVSSIENSFTKGLITEYTGVNFPEDAATDCDNCEFTIAGDVIRRQGITQEVGYGIAQIDRTECAISQYTWVNAGGNGDVVFEVLQIGTVVYFYSVTKSSVSTPLSTQLQGITLVLPTYLTVGHSFDATKECQFADGNGYLFVFHPSIDPVFVQYNNGDNTISTGLITIQIRDFIGVNDQLSTNTRPADPLTAQHSYNLQNQGWTSAPAWGANSTDTVASGLGSKAWTVAAGIVGIAPGQVVSIVGTNPAIYGIFARMVGTVVSYVGTTLTINVTSENHNSPYPIDSWSFTPTSIGYISTFFGVEIVYPSNADVWWYFKNAAGAFDPATTVGNVTLSIGRAPQGHFIMNVFNQDRTLVSGLGATLPTVSTASRPTTGTFFQGRVWYTGINASAAPSNDTYFYNWSENIYFSQVVSTIQDFGSCYQVNDPTSENLNGLLPTDGGVITIQGCGYIYKLFPVVNGLLVFATNGIWFITGSQGIGFTANDYTVTKLSNVRSMSPTSFVDVMGLPYFWNQEGIYQIVPNQSGALTVNPITVGTILSFYNDIPTASKKFVRGAYDPVNYVIQWCYRSTQETTVTDRYSFDRILNFNVYNKAFFPYTVSNNITVNTYINGVSYISYPYTANYIGTGYTIPEAGFKYPCSTFSSGVSSYLISFADEHDSNYVDWGSADYNSYFVTGYKLHGQGQKKFQIPYIYMFSRTNGVVNQYTIQGLWDYASSGDSGRWSTAELATIFDLNYSMKYRRHRIRGNGLTLQFKVSSVTGAAFDIMGWSVYENVNQGV